jgi:hypothetical protein
MEPSAKFEMQARGRGQGADGRGQRPGIRELVDSNSAHPLDDVIWKALTSCHRDLA